MIGRRPQVAVGNSIGDRQMLEYTYAGLSRPLTSDHERERDQPKLRNRPNVPLCGPGVRLTL